MTATIDDQTGIKSILLGNGYSPRIRMSMYLVLIAAFVAVVYAWFAFDVDYLILLVVPLGIFTSVRSYGLLALVLGLSSPAWRLE